MAPCISQSTLTNHALYLCYKFFVSLRLEKVDQQQWVYFFLLRDIEQHIFRYDLLALCVFPKQLSRDNKNAQIYVAFLQHAVLFLKFLSGWNKRQTDIKSQTGRKYLYCKLHIFIYVYIYFFLVERIAYIKKDNSLEIKVLIMELEAFTTSFKGNNTNKKAIVTNSGKMILHDLAETW